MKKEYFKGYVLKNGKLVEKKIPKEKAIKAIKKQLKKDKDFLEIMAKM